MTLTTFRVGQRRFSIDRALVRAVIEAPTLSPAPHAPAWLRGAYNDLGRAVAAVDVAAVLGLDQAAQPTHWLVLAQSRSGTLGLCADGPAEEVDTQGLPRRGRVVEIVNRATDLLYLDLALLEPALEAALAAHAEDFGL